MDVVSTTTDSGTRAPSDVWTPRYPADGVARSLSLGQFRTEFGQRLEVITHSETSSVEVALDPGDLDGSYRKACERVDRLVEKLQQNVADLQLTDVQEQTVREAMAKLFAVKTAAPGGIDTSIADPAALRQRVQAAIEQTLAPLLSDEQRPLFDKWKRGRENTKAGAVHILDASNTPERRAVRLGISDDQFSEIAGGQLTEGERVIVRARDASK